MKESKLKRINIILSIWASIATIISLFFGYQLSINSKQNIIYGDNNGKMINADSYINQVLDNPQSYSETEILRQAQLAFDAKDYSDVRKLYTLDKVANNPTTYNNIGYMYANGLGVEKNVDLAIEYYNLASTGVDENIIVDNKYALLSENLEDPNAKRSVQTFIKFVNENLKKKKGKIFELFKNANNGEALYEIDYEILTKKLTTEWKDVIPSEMKTFEEDPPLNFTSGYRFIKSQDISNGKDYGQVRVYKKVERVCRVLHVIDDKFIYI